jgi:thioredoxin 2
MAAPEVSAVAQEMAGEALVLKVDTEREPELSARYRIQSIPNFMVFHQGKPVLQRSGVAPRAEMKTWLKQAGAPAAQ